jgi:Cys-tRNA(Pro)/Cys-tRNA(Cys) deacylase
LEPKTGYVHGGCSPIGMKKPFPTFIDEIATLYDTLFVSGGRIGLQIEIAPSDLAKITGAVFCNIYF